MTLKYKSIKAELTKIFKLSNIGIRDVVYNGVQSIRNYPAIRINLKSREIDDDNQVLQNNKQLSWVAYYEVIVLFRGSEAEASTDQAITFVDSVVDIILKEKDNQYLLNNTVCDLSISGVDYFTAPSDKGYIYGGNISLNLHYIENR